MQNGLLSVIMSTYNERLDWIELSIESILKQTYTDLEFIIVMDNPANIKLKGLLETYEAKDSRVKLLMNEQNQGLVKSLNRALNHCNGRYVARMDADDISDFDRLELQKKYLEEQQLDVVFSGVRVIDEEGIEQYKTNTQTYNERKTKKMIERINISFHPTWFLKKEVYDCLNGYREVNYCEDYDFLLRSLSQGFKVRKMPMSILQYRVRDSSISRSHSLEQFLNAQAILHLYRNNQLEEKEKLMEIQHLSRNMANEKERHKYTRADSYYLKGHTFLKNGRILRGGIYLIKSILLSKYYSKRNIEVFKYKLTHKR